MPEIFYDFLKAFAFLNTLIANDRFVLNFLRSAGLVEMVFTSSLFDMTASRIKATAMSNNRKGRHDEEGKKDGELTYKCSEPKNRPC